MSLEVGNKVEGKITGLAKFGAFIDLGNNKTGLVHISEVSDKFVEDINDELKVGQVVTVQILSIDDNGKIALSMRNREKEAEEKKEQPKPEYKKRETSNRRPSKPFNKKQSNNSQDFDSLMNDFLKESETRLSSLRKNTENKRGGRGGRRS
ncbi:S1 RNA binding domain protein [Atopostipes suicloacalis DSM 15692]|uniref:S1 RNA binding domain protein n=1 Tax=Atopostipes suicloacalis DSM 15692 TaxID=1121025 RepID=A0A1M4V6Q6_9LACT|nr:S1 domain-containing RNA-binding protein [Atopostipes suicloacalis]SHE64538.1 S1 RNA binding domain protein [Atopostipes suicloacalis DSM 15692]